MAPYQRSNDTLEATVIHLFQKGITMTEIAHFIEKMYVHYYTTQTISSVTKAVSEQVKAFNQLPLHTRYVYVYLDAAYIAVRREIVSKEAVYITIGIYEDGSKEVLAYTIAPTESAHNWKELLEELNERGVEDVLLFISDGLKGMVDTISSVFPKARYQTCLVHVARKLSHKVLVENRQAVCDDFKTVYKADCLESGREALDAFCLKWQKAYPKMVKSLQINQHMLTFYSFPKEIWRSIYSTH
ncbi:Mutator family transposase [Bacillus cytotoxicus]|uniref:Mutator family transposase n=1 Tax=Bacillus cytotoxicus TaxID=580165 RepID=A0AAX2CHN9_9BACI|nr:Mutator family transposase [Bacillus cytotoxicus]SCN37810.1 Mutator family transposase [Bacillus cytotoxicus]